MVIAVSCECGKTYRVKPEHAGKRGKCPNCDRTLTIPDVKTQSHDVFLSHSHKDKHVADAVCAKLESGGTRCWIAPRDLVPGQEWSEAIIDGINCCRVMVVIFSGHSNASAQVTREVERAINKGLVILPFRIEDVPMTKRLEYFLSASHWLDAFTPPLEAHIKTLHRSVDALLNQQATPSTTSRPDTSPDHFSSSPTELVRPWVFAIGTVLLILIAVLIWSVTKPGSPNATVASERTQTPQEVLDLRSQVSVAWDQIKGIDRGQAIGVELDRIDATLRSADTLFDREEWSALEARYTSLIQDIDSLKQLAAEREKTLEYQTQVRALRAQLQSEVEPIGNVFFEQGDAEQQDAASALEQGDFVAAGQKFQAAEEHFERAIAYARSASDIQAAKLDFESELDGYHLATLQKNKSAWLRLNQQLTDAEQAIEAGQFEEAVAGYQIAKRLLLEMGPVATGLQMKVELEFIENALQDVLSLISYAVDVNFVTNWSTLEEIGIDQESLVTVNVTGLTAAAALKQVLSGLDADLGYTIRKGQFVYVSTKSDLEALKEQDPIASLSPLLSAGSTLATAVETPTEADFIDTWLIDWFDWVEDISEPSLQFHIDWTSFDPAIVHKNSSFNLSLKSTTLRQQLWLVSALFERHLGFLPLGNDGVLFVASPERIAELRRTSPFAESFSQIPEQLRNQRITLQLFDIPFDESLNYLSYLVDENDIIRVNESALIRENIDLQRLVSIDVKNVTLETALWLLWADSETPRFKYEAAGDNVILVQPVLSAEEMIED